MNSLYLLDCLSYEECQYLSLANLAALELALCICNSISSSSQYYMSVGGGWQAGVYDILFTMEAVKQKASDVSIGTKLRLAKMQRLMRANTYLVFMLIAIISVLCSVIVWQLWA